MFERVVRDLRMLLRLEADQEPDPTAATLDARTLRSTVESGGRAGYDGHKRTNGSKIHAAVDTLGHLLALRVTAASEQERAQARPWPRRCSGPRAKPRRRERVPV